MAEVLPLSSSSGNLTKFATYNKTELTEMSKVNKSVTQRPILLKTRKPIGIKTVEQDETNKQDLEKTEPVINEVKNSNREDNVNSCIPKKRRYYDSSSNEVVFCDLETTEGARELCNSTVEKLTNYNLKILLLHQKHSSLQNEVETLKNFVSQLEQYNDYLEKQVNQVASDLNEDTLSFFSVD